MASRISHRSRRKSRSFSRLMVTRARGMASVVRSIRIVVATISSTRVKPCWGCLIGPFSGTADLIKDLLFEERQDGAFLAHKAMRAWRTLLNGDRCGSSSHQRGLHAGVAHT